MTKTAAPRKLNMTEFRLLNGFIAGHDDAQRISSKQEPHRQSLEDDGFIAWNVGGKKWVATPNGRIAYALHQDADETILDAEDLEMAKTIRDSKTSDQGTAKAPKPKAEPKQPTACKCSEFWAGNTLTGEGGDVIVKDERTTGCDAVTSKTFAQGHDAKLVSFLVAAELDGLEVHWAESSADAHTLLSNAGWDALAVKFANSLQVAKDKAAARARRDVAKAEKAKTAKSEPATEPEPVESADLDELVATVSE